MPRALISNQFMATCAALALVAGCSAGSDGAKTTPNPAFDAAETAEAVLSADVAALLASEGETLQAELPTTDTATYTGMIHGEPTGGAGPAIEYFADLSLTVDFTDEDLTGTIDNVKTDLTGFTEPSGSVTVTGTIDNTGPTATLEFSGSDTLSVSTGAMRSATFDFDTTSGDFIGDTAQAVSGLHDTTFIWINGETGTSDSDGDWNATQ